MLYNGVFGCHGNTCYVICIGAILYMLYSIGPINVCTDFEINRYKIRKYEKITFYLIYLTSCDAKTLHHASWGLRHFWYIFWQGTFWNQPEVSTTSGSKVMAQIVVFVFSLTLTFDLCSICFVTRIAHDVLEYPCEVSLESVQYEWVICCG